MIEYNVGVAVEESYIVKKIDLDYLKELWRQTWLHKRTKPTNRSVGFGIVMG